LSLPLMLHRLHAFVPAVIPPSHCGYSCVLSWSGAYEVTLILFRRGWDDMGWPCIACRYDSPELGVASSGCRNLLVHSAAASQGRLCISMCDGCFLLRDQQDRGASKGITPSIEGERWPPTVTGCSLVKGLAVPDTHRTLTKLVKERRPVASVSQLALAPSLDANAETSSSSRTG
jgi:hypothetical protein